MNAIIVKTEPLGAPWKAQDPFMFCAYHRDEYPEGNEQSGLNPDQLKGRDLGHDFVPLNGFRMYHGSMVPGFPYHPHSGFETVTIAVEGVIDHTDSLGGAGRFKAGDVQWLTSGRGIQHSEMFPLLNRDTGNPFELFQIWLNLPAKSKKVDPFYKMLWREDIPLLQAEDENGKITQVNVIAGTLNGKKALNPPPDSWAADPNNGVAIFTIKMEAGATWTLPASDAAGTHRNLYFYRGSNITIDGQNIDGNSRVVLDPMQDATIKNGDKDAFLIMLQGKPIGEPVVQYGPFVANTQQEIRDTMALYQKTQFGGWPWPMKEQIFDRSKGRFARYSNGIEEEK